MTRDDLLEHLQPALDDLVDRIAAMLPELVRAELDTLLGRLTSDIAPPAKVRARRDPKPEKKPYKAARVKSGPTCSKCSATGHNARTCGREDPKEVARSIVDSLGPKSSPPGSPPPERSHQSLCRNRSGRARETWSLTAMRCRFTRSFRSPSDRSN